jgi:hypothetical protein
MINILVFPCGSEIALEVHRSLIQQKDINLIGVSSVDDHGKFVFDTYIGKSPLINDDNFIGFFQELVKTYNIDFIYPCMDIVIEKFVNNEEKFDCKIISSPKETVNICTSKLKTYNELKDVVLTPKIFNKENITEYPIFSKPEIGASSRGTVKINNQIDLEYWTSIYPKNLLLEYLPGDEYTVDCFTNKKGELLFIGPRIRGRISNGISVNTTMVKNTKLTEIAHKLNNLLSFNGSWFFQVKKNKYGEFCLMEIASRFGGSSVIHRLLGVNFSYLNILNELYDDIEININNFEIQVDRSLDVKTKINLKYNTLYIDFDDTIIINNKVNLEAIQLIYKCINEGKTIILITKHKNYIYDTLEKYNISEKLFNTIITLSITDEKSSFINDNKSIFVDDSFSERKKVTNKLNIPTFSVENIKLLL